MRVSAASKGHAVSPNPILKQKIKIQKNEETNFFSCVDIIYHVMRET
jgi:hypothetical protein